MCDLNEILQVLQEAYGPDATFREGQSEAILAILRGQNTLVVQKTGWGKSLVYFLATKILRRQHKGFTLIISPLVALMDNQVSSAGRLHLQVRTIHSENRDLWDTVLTELDQDRVDALIISPERLANQEFRDRLVRSLAARIGLFVVDEAHCISDWGHDFRPDFRRIIDIIHLLPPNIPVLATTATANNRVIADIQAQLGSDIKIQRGSLMRESLALQVMRLDSKEERLAWLKRNVPDLPGSGLIYCLTVADCDLVNRWLQQNGIASTCYFADMDAETKQQAIADFMANRIKALVATVAFGMGFDKPDIGFVIHFQKPGNVVAYYQQIGRAGRALDTAYAILMCGKEDDAINHYFIDTAFPTEDLMNGIVAETQKRDGMKLTDYEQAINMKRSKIEVCLRYLTVSGDIYKEKNLYYKSPRPWKPDLEKCARITAIRRRELQQMNTFIHTQDCYMEFIAKCLDDDSAGACGRCANCQGHLLVHQPVLPEDIAQAEGFLKKDFQVLAPRKQWPTGIKVDGKAKIALDRLCGEGRVLSVYDDAGWGGLVMQGKYRTERFDDALVSASANLLRTFVRENHISWVTAVPSRVRPVLVPDFAQRLAKALNLPYGDALGKVEDAPPQNQLNNSTMKFENAFRSIGVRQRIPQGNVLLVDDCTDSGWTFTVCGYLLRRAGSGEVYPFALANSAGRSGAGNEPF